MKQIFFRYLNHNVSKEFVKFIIVGLINTILNILTFYTCFDYLSLSIHTSFIIGFLVGALVGYFLNHNFTFKKLKLNGQRFLVFNTPIVLVKYMFLQCVNMLIGLLILSLLINITFLSTMILLCQIITISFTTIINFTVSKFLIFKTK